MEVVGGVLLAGGSAAKVVTGSDDQSRFCVSAYAVDRATARRPAHLRSPGLAMLTHGVLDRSSLTFNGKVFTGRFGPGTGEVLFDRICRENRIRHAIDKQAAGLQ